MLIQSVTDGARFAPDTWPRYDTLLPGWEKPTLEERETLTKWEKLCWKKSLDAVLKRRREERDKAAEEQAEAEAAPNAAGEQAEAEAAEAMLVDLDTAEPPSNLASIETTGGIAAIFKARTPPRQGARYVQSLVVSESEFKLVSCTATTGETEDDAEWEPFVPEGEVDATEPGLRYETTMLPGADCNPGDTLNVRPIMERIMLYGKVAGHTASGAPAARAWTFMGMDAGIFLKAKVLTENKAANLHNVALIPAFCHEEWNYMEAIQVT